MFKFTYNASGIRTGKTLPDGTEITYYLDGAQILAEETRDAQGALTDTVYYQYGVDGITGFKHNGTTYLYRKNIQGDITHIYGKEASGKITLKAEYKYDGFGNREIIKDTNGIGVKNAFGYRGYYYDASTNMYYLQSRYYSPELIRFLNADKISYLDPETLNGLNLYSYCGNNPIMLTDSTGTSWKSFWSGVGNWFSNNWDIVVGIAVTIGIAAFSIATFGIGTVIVGVVAGAVIGAGFGAVNALVNGDNILYGMLSGMVVGGLGGMGGLGLGGMIIAGLSSAAGAFTMSVIGDRVNGRERNFTKAGISALTAGIFSFLGNGAGNYFANTGKELVVKIVGNSLGSFIFGSYTFISDFIYDAFRRKR